MSFIVAARKPITKTGARAGGGFLQLSPQTKAVAEAVNLLTHLRALVEAARRAGTVVFYVPHRS